MSIQPLFVFDGPNKPPFKRNKRTGPNVASVPEFLAKQLLKQFGIPWHLAPGEAEAECALLQQKGVVDAVLSEDVDTLMFGSGMTLRSWTPEPSVKTKTPTHVNVYDAKETKRRAGLDRPGMVLVAIMSGGDYIPEGIPGCGPKIACEAARAGFGEDLLNIKKGDHKALKEWKDRLEHELKTNQSKFFNQKHKAMKIPDDFPRMDVLHYYKKPVVSSEEKVQQLRETVQWDQDFDIPGLRTFCEEAFDWRCISGAKHFVRNLSHALLIRRLRLHADKPTFDDAHETAVREAELIKTIYSRRQHASTDNTDELRVGFKPIDIVPIDLDAEEPDLEDAMQMIDADDDDAEAGIEELNENTGETSSPKKKRKPTAYDPTSINKIWVFETIVKVGAPLKVEDWEESFRNAKKYEAMKALRKRTENEDKAKKKRNGMKKGALDPFTRVTKPGVKVSKSRSPEPIVFTQPVPMPRVDEMEPLSPTQPLLPGRETERASKDPSTQPSQVQPLLSSPLLAPQRLSREVETIELLSSSPSSTGNFPLKQPLHRSMSDPFTFAERQEFQNALPPSSPPDSENDSGLSETKLQSTVRQSRSPLRKTQTLPQSTTKGECEDNDLHLPKISQCTVLPEFATLENTHPGNKSITAFRIPRELPPTPKMPGHKITSVSGSPSHRLKSQPHQTTKNAKSPKKTTAASSLPSTPRSCRTQQQITHYLSSSPSSPSPARSRRARELSPFYADSGPGYDYSEGPALGTGLLNECEELEGHDAPSVGDTVHNEAGAQVRHNGNRSSRKPMNRANRRPLSHSDGNRRHHAAWKMRERQRRVVRLRESLMGAFALDGLEDSPNADLVSDDVTLKSAKKGRRWRVSDVEMVDLTTI